MEQREEHAEYAVLIDHSLYNYYFARGEFERAYEIGDAYDFEKNRKKLMPGDVFDHFSGFNWKVPYIFYAVGKLEEYIPFYDTVKDDTWLKSDRQLYGSAPLEFWLAAAYGQRGEFERAFEYLKKALEKATLYNPITEVGGDIFANMEYDNLLAIIWHCYMSDAMDAFRDAGHFDKLENMLKIRLSDFWRLEWISGWQ
jgi:tetratricopeptide (TPR) repeat protein